MQDLETSVRQYADSAAFREALGIPREEALCLSKLAQGECNVNFLLERPGDKKKLVLRVNLVSQMHLSNQVGYEYAALSALSESGRTPKPLYLDSTAQIAEGERIGNGLMVYEYLPGRPLSYRTDLLRAAELLADIHSCPYLVPDSSPQVSQQASLVTVSSSLRVNQQASPVTASSSLQASPYTSPCSAQPQHYMVQATALPKKEASGIRLIEAHSPLRMILEECTEMFKTYQNAEIADRDVRKRIETMLEAGYARFADSVSEGNCRCIINTELNSGNFLMNDGGRDYLIDWEKPLLGAPAQDLGHFLAPTTTLWKTDVLLTEDETARFVKEHLRAAAGRIDTEGLSEALQCFLPVTCLRGLTWSAMAWVQYQDPASKAPKNRDTWNKLCSYLSADFLDLIEKRYFSD